MALPTLDEIKAQCRIDNDLEDGLLLNYLNASAAEVERLTNRKLYFDKIPESDPYGLMISFDIKIRMLQMIGFWYENREGQSLPISLSNALMGYRIRPMRGAS